MTRREALALDPRPTGWRARSSDRLLAFLHRISVVLDRLSGTSAPTVTPRASFDRPGPSGDDIAMQPTLPPEALR